MLWLALFSQAEHFQSIRKKGDGDSGAAEVEDRLAIPHRKDLSEAARKERGEVVKVPQGVNTTIDQVLASLLPNHGFTPEQTSNVLSRVKGNLGEAVEILLEEIEHGSGSDGRVDEMLAFRTTSPAGTMVSSESEGGTGSGSGSGTGTGTSKVTTPSAGDEEMKVAEVGEGMGMEELRVRSEGSKGAPIVVE